MGMTKSCIGDSSRCPAGLRGWRRAVQQNDGKDMV